MVDRNVSAADLLVQFRGVLGGMRHRAPDLCWQSLAAALEPTALALGAEPTAQADAPAWSATVDTLDASLANDISEATKAFSLALKEHYRTVTPRDQRVSTAIAFLYMDVERPLWSAHPSLEPAALRSP